MTQKLEVLVQIVEKAQSALETAEEKLNEATKDLPQGFVTNISGLPYQIVVLGGKNVLRPMLSKRQIAAIKGLPVPELRVRRRKDEIAKAAE